mmetsp:Transcript_59696/g.144207  ORF Transcript_59696/g.144207 Transcript_59696/m.144207 type:complete len:314 (+) Transcript_59696:195-1136(+)
MRAFRSHAWQAWASSSVANTMVSWTSARRPNWVGSVAGKSVSASVFATNAALDDAAAPATAPAPRAAVSSVPLAEAASPPPSPAPAPPPACARSASACLHSSSSSARDSACNARPKPCGLLAKNRRAVGSTAVVIASYSAERRATRPTASPAASCSLAIAATSVSRLNTSTRGPTALWLSPIPSNISCKSRYDARKLSEQLLGSIKYFADMQRSIARRSSSPKSIATAPCTILRTNSFSGATFVFNSFHSSARLCVWSSARPASSSAHFMMRFISALPLLICAVKNASSTKCSCSLECTLADCSIWKSAIWVP